MEKLNQNQLDIIDEKISIGGDKYIVMLNVAGKKNLPPAEHNSNVYCVNHDNEVLWQIKVKPTGFERDSFVNIWLENKVLFARNFSGFEYRVNLQNGETEMIGWDK